MLRAYKYRIYPTTEQRTLLEKHFGCTRWIYNWALAEKTARYAEAGESVSQFELMSHLPELKDREDTAWLTEVSAQSLQQSLRHLDVAFTRFFKGQGAYPAFKSRYDRRQSFHCPQRVRVDFENQRIYIPKFKQGIKSCLHRVFDGKVKATTVSRTPTGKYYASVLVETADVEPIPSAAERSTAVGLDFGLKDLVITSDGRRFENPRALKRYMRRLKIRQRRLSRATKGSKRRERARLTVAKTHERIFNVRSNNLHQISSELTRKNHGVGTLCIEDLSVQSMTTGPRAKSGLNRSIQDAGWRELRRQLEYKCKWYGKNLRVIGRFEASSKTCSCCGHTYSALTLSERTWTCTSCGANHDRDVNAAINIKTFAFCEQDTTSKSLFSTSVESNYRQVGRKVTPLDESVRTQMNGEWNHDCSTAA